LLELKKWFIFINKKGGTAGHTRPFTGCVFFYTQKHPIFRDFIDFGDPTQFTTHNNGGII